MSSATLLQHLEVLPVSHHSEEGTVSILGKQTIRLMLSKMNIMNYLWRADACVVGLAREIVVNLKNEHLQLKREAMEVLKAGECCCGFWIANGSREPVHPQELNSMQKRQLPIAEVEANGMNFIRVNDGKIVTRRSLGACEWCCNGVAKLNAKPKDFQQYFAEVVASPLLRQTAISSGSSHSTVHILEYDGVDSGHGYLWYSRDSILSHKGN
jgi:uncharacterized protein YdcH (DUF465 family)